MFNPQHNAMLLLHEHRVSMSNRSHPSPSPPPSLPPRLASVPLLLPNGPARPTSTSPTLVTDPHSHSPVAAAGCRAFQRARQRKARLVQSMRSPPMSAPPFLFERSAYHTCLSKP